MSVAVVVPYRETDAARRHAWSWIARRYHELHPDWPVIVAEPNGVAWHKGEAVANALVQVTNDVAVVADADSFVPVDVLCAAVEAVQAGAPWAVPHATVWRLGPHFTGLLLRRGALDVPPPAYLPRRPQRVAPVGGGIVVGPRAALLDVPLDPRFEGWGGEDIAWGWALDTLAGAHHAVGGELYHLHHAPAPTRRRALWETEVLAGRYAEASGDPHAMRELIEEARCTR